MNATKPNGSRSFNAVELGAMMCEVRENLGHDLETVARELNIRLDYLQAIETGQLSDLPGNVYVSGFTRAYAVYLGLEGDKIVRQFKAAGVASTDRTSLNLPSPVEEGRLPTALILALGALITVGAYGGWYLFSAQGRDTTRGVSKLSSEMSVLIKKTKNEVEEKSERPRKPAPLPVLPSEGPPSPASGVTLQPGSLAPAGVEVMTPPPVSAQTAPIASAQTQTNLVIPTVKRAPQETLTTSNIVIRAIADSYVVVRNTDIILFRGLLRRGDVYEVPLGIDLILDTGNAGGLQISFDDKVVAPLGLSGEVRRYIPLNAVKLLRGQNQ